MNGRRTETLGHECPSARRRRRARVYGSQAAIARPPFKAESTSWLRAYTRRQWLPSPCGKTGG
jgi:hypothetical protein